MTPRACLFSMLILLVYYWNYSLFISLLTGPYVSKKYMRTGPCDLFYKAHTENKSLFSPTIVPLFVWHIGVKFSHYKYLHELVEMYMYTLVFTKALQILYGCISGNMDVTALALPREVHCHPLCDFSLPLGWIVFLQWTWPTSFKHGSQNIYHLFSEQQNMGI